MIRMSIVQKICQRG